MAALLRMSDKIYSIQYLRGLAAMLVVVSHALEMIPGLQREIPAPVGDVGVAIFFVVSGFIMVHVTQTREQRPSTFLLARALRIVPLYWLFTLGAALMLASAPYLYHANELSFRHLLLSMFFVPHVMHAGTIVDIKPLIKAGWTLNYEVFFYALFAAAMRISHQRRVLLVSIVLLVIVAGGYLLRLTNPGHGFSDESGWFFANYYSQDIVLEFAIGMGLAVFYPRLRELNVPLAALIASILLSVLMFQFGKWLLPVNSRLLLRGIPAATIVCSALLCQPSAGAKEHRWLTLLGDASYSLYLSHMLPVAVLRWLWKRLALPTHGLPPAVLICVAGIVLSTIIGMAVYHFIERPMLDWSRKIRQRVFRENETVPMAS